MGSVTIRLVNTENQSSGWLLRKPRVRASCLEVGTRINMTRCVNDHPFVKQSCITPVTSYVLSTCTVLNHSGLQCVIYPSPACSLLTSLAMLAVSCWLQMALSCTRIVTKILIYKLRSRIHSHLICHETRGTSQIHASTPRCLLSIFLIKSKGKTYILMFYTRYVFHSLWK